MEYEKVGRSRLAHTPPGERLSIIQVASVSGIRTTAQIQDGRQLNAIVQNQAVSPLLIF